MLNIKGEGVARDPVRGYFWMLLAAAQKSDIAAHYFAVLRDKVSPAEKRLIVKPATV